LWAQLLTLPRHGRAVLVIALLVLVLIFGVLFFGRVAGARRAELAARWPVILLAAAGMFTLLRGGVWLALALFVVSGLVFMWSAPRAPPPLPDDAADAEARRILGVARNATAQDIRAAYRAKMAHAHPDRGGAHGEAARLTAARDRLLRRR
jgi:hypothetical protein